MKYSKLLSALIFSVCFSGSVFAAPLHPDSELSYVTLLTPMASDESTVVSLGDADFLSFAGGGFVFDAHEDFAPLLGTTLSLSDFHIDPFGGPGGSVPPVTIWTGVGGFTFTLDSLYIDDQSDLFLNLSGYGHVSGGGFDTTDGFWTLSANTTVGANFVFTAQTAVPEPSPVALFGLVLLAIGVVSRRKLLVNS